MNEPNEKEILAAVGTCREEIERLWLEGFSSAEIATKLDLPQPLATPCLAAKSWDTDRPPVAHATNDLSAKGVSRPDI